MLVSGPAGGWHLRVHQPTVVRGREPPSRALPEVREGVGQRGGALDPDWDAGVALHQPHIVDESRLLTASGARQDTRVRPHQLRLALPGPPIKVCPSRDARPADRLAVDGHECPAPHVESVGRQGELLADGEGIARLVENPCPRGARHARGHGNRGHSRSHWRRHRQRDGHDRRRIASRADDVVLPWWRGQASRRPLHSRVVPTLGHEVHQVSSSGPSSKAI
eukprot:9487843-Pyramimonas_sp.AAC.1